MAASPRHRAGALRGSRQPRRAHPADGELRRTPVPVAAELPSSSSSRWRRRRRPQPAARGSASRARSAAMRLFEYAVVDERHLGVRHVEMRRTASVSASARSGKTGADGRDGARQAVVAGRRNGRRRGRSPDAAARSRHARLCFALDPTLGPARTIPASPGGGRPGPPLAGVCRAPWGSRSGRRGRRADRPNSRRPILKASSPRFPVPPSRRPGDDLLGDPLARALRRRHELLSGS